MQLSHLIRELDILRISGDVSGDVSSICYDSQKCEEGSLFVAIPGHKSDGHDYISDAVNRGSRYIVHEKDINTKPEITYIKVADSRWTLGVLGKNFFENPSSKLCLIGITGTNGKTTISYLLESILTSAGFQVGVIGTVNYRFKGKEFPAPITTPESIDLQKMLREMADSGITHVILEVSSHSLDLKRVNSCEFKLGIFTNLSRDHLDYHHTMERYFLAKKIFFEEILNVGKKMIINSDDIWGQKLLEEIDKKAKTFGIKSKSDVSTENFTISQDGIRGEIKTPHGKFTIHSSMIGKFNLYNILAAITAALMLRIPEEHIQAGVENLKTIPGRLEKVSEEGQPTVFVDYAHTEDALRRVLMNLAELAKGKIITVFGCGGDRDRGKRPLMGNAVTTLSDITIVTSDNPRTEDPLTIIKEIEKGIIGLTGSTVKKFSPDELNKNLKNKGYTIVPDRKAAIELAIAIANVSDIVLIAGKGHENYQIIGTRRTPFDDRIVSAEALKKVPKV